MADDLVIASTTDTEAQIKAALDPPEEATPPTLSETDRTTGETTPPESEAAAPADDAASADLEAQPRKVEGEEKPAAEKPKKKSRSEERIGELTRDKYLAQRKAERLEAELAAIRQREEQTQQQYQQYLQRLQPPPRPAAEPAAPSPNQPPQVNDFNVYEDFVTATAQWNARRAAAEAVQAMRQEDAQHYVVQQQQEVLTQFEGAKTGARERYPDFDEVMTSDVAINMPLSESMQHVITTSPVGHDVAYYLVQHPDVATAIQQQAPLDALRTLGRLEERIASVLQTPPP